MFINLKKNFKFQIDEIPSNDEDKALVNIFFTNDLFNVSLTNSKLLTLGDLKRFQHYLESLIDDSIQSNGTL